MAGTMPSGGGRARTIAAINVTPLVDVVLASMKGSHEGSNGKHGKTRESDKPAKSAPVERAETARRPEAEA